MEVLSWALADVGSVPLVALSWIAVPLALRVLIREFVPGFRWWWCVVWVFTFRGLRFLLATLFPESAIDNENIPWSVVLPLWGASWATFPLHHSYRIRGFVLRIYTPVG